MKHRAASLRQQSYLLVEILVLAESSWVAQCVWFICVNVGWIAPVPGDVRHARCRYCCVLLNAHRNDLLRHSRSAKHAANVAFGRPCTDSELTSEAITRSVMQLSEKRQRLARKKSRFSECRVTTVQMYTLWVKKCNVKLGHTAFAKVMLKCPVCFDSQCILTLSISLIALTAGLIFKRLTLR